VPAGPSQADWPFHPPGNATRVSSRASRFGVFFAALNSGALIVISALSFRSSASAWITLGLASLALLAGLAGFAMPDQGGGPRLVEGLLVLGGAWTIIAARVFSGPHLIKWLCFADGVMIWALGGLGLLAHQLLSEGRLRRLLEDERYRYEMTRFQDPERAAADDSGAVR
jgi:hypothetical protein